MKLYARTLLFFISTVVFQSIFTILFITSSVVKDTQQQAQREINRESEYSYSRYNSWVRGLWKDIFQIKNDPYVRGTIFKTDRHSEIVVNTYLKEYMNTVGIDSIIIQDSKSGKVDVIRDRLWGITGAFINDFNFKKTYPFIELRLINDTVYLCAIFHMTERKRLNIVFLKQINNDFYSFMASSDQTILFFSTDKTTAKKRLGDDFSIKSFIHDSNATLSYSEMMNIVAGTNRYNASVRTIGVIHGPAGSDKLYLVLLMPNKPYEEMLIRIREIVLYVSFLAALLTIFLSVFFSRRITYFFNKLTSAMHSIREGDYSIQVPANPADEVRNLITGFNGMVKQLRNNKETMDTYIKQITFLKDYNEKIFQSLNTGILIVNNDLTIEKVNRSFLDDFGCTEEAIIGFTVNDLSLDVMDNSLSGYIIEINKGTKTYYSKIVRIDKGVFEVKLYPLYTVPTAENVKCVVEIDDISQKIELEEKIMQAEKLSSLSLLSAGISHEINNPLGSIMTNVQNLIAEEQSKEKKESLFWIEQETRRIARIVRELLDFSSSDIINSEGSDVNRCIKETIRVIEYGIKKEKRINFKLDLGWNISLVSVSRDEMKQILINLIQNSLHAIDSDGIIRIITKEDQALEKVYLEIYDTGLGMTSEIIPHIFDPFYTTKANGVGTGLGLSIVYGIIKKYAGSIDVESKEGDGTNIKLSFPFKEEKNEYIDS